MLKLVIEPVAKRLCKISTHSLQSFETFQGKHFFGVLTKNFFFFLLNILHEGSQLHDTEHT